MLTSGRHRDTYVEDGDFEAGVVANANVGGDNCHRGAVIGALSGAAGGLEGIPQWFREGLRAGPSL